MKTIKWLKFLKLVLWDEGVLQKTANTLLIVLTILALIFTDLKEWPYWILVLLMLFIAWWYFTFSWAYKKWKGELSSNWITRYELEHGELPSLPSFFIKWGMVGNYTDGQPVRKGIALKIASGQCWHNLDPSQQEQILELWEWLGKDRRDYIAQMKRMLPPGGKGMTLHHKR